MATDYKKINVKSRINLSSIRDQRGDKTHFVYELIQNADDSKSKRLELYLCEKELLVWNDGCKFREEDVLRISSIGFSDKALTQIGNFGTGFKAVYNYTDRPEIYSGDERFCLPDHTSTSKTLEDLASSSLVEGIDKVPPRIAELVEEGKTVFRLPFKENLSQKDLMLLKDQLRKLLKKRPLLFLPHLEMIQWHDICNGQTGVYCRCPQEKIQRADQVELKASMNGENLESEKFLIFSKKFQPRQDVINELLQTEYDAERRKRVQETAEELQPIEVAFKLQDGRITAMDSCVLFAYLPTEKETHLRFLIQARYQTNPARNDIEKTEQNPWNRWLVEETAKFLPEVLEELKEAGLLEPAFFNVLPLKGEVENDFKPIAKASRKAMREQILVPTQDGGYAKAENVFYPHRGSLRKLIECSWLYPNSSWLHPDIGRSGHAFDVMREAGVKEIDVSHVLNWLEKQDLNWFESRCEKWLCALYVYLNTQKSELERIKGVDRIKKLPLIRLENGQHVCASNGLVFFPPETDEAREEIMPFLNDLPILRSTLLGAEDKDDIKGFLDHVVGVKTLHPKTLIHEWMIPQYSQPDKPSGKENVSHMRYLFKVWDKLSRYERSNLREKISKTSILRAYNGAQPDICGFIKPCDAYLPETYTSDDNLETYFSVYNGEVWFVDKAYLEDRSDVKVWLQFLKAIGAKDTPRSIKKIIRAKSGYDQEFSKELNKRDIKWEYTTQWRNHWSKTSIEDFYLEGLSEVLTEISEHKRIDLSQVLWHLLVKVLLSELKRRDAFFKGTYHWSYYGPQSEDFDAMFYGQLKEFAWLPDEQGNLHRPSECFAPTDDNRKVLGNSVAYLHPDFDVSQDNEAAHWLADKTLKIHLNANTESVLNYLQKTLSGTAANVEKVEPLYRFLARQDARPREEFKENPLIFTANPEPRWWKSDEVFWGNENPVFGNRRGYLEENYADYETTLKPFFIALGVSELAVPLDYVQGIQDIAFKGQVESEEIRNSVQWLYRRLSQSLQEGGSWQRDEEWQKEWKRTREGKCWLGKKGDEWDFFSFHELVWKDDDYRSRLFKDKISFWAFDDDLLEFAKYLGVNGCYEISDVEFNYHSAQGENQIWSEKVQNLYPYIYDFLNSPRLCEQYIEEQAAEILERLSVHRAQRLEIRYRLNGESVLDPDSRQSFLDKKREILWLGLEEDEEAYPDLIGDALQDDFRIDQLREFIKDLLPSVNLSKTALLNWKRRGFQADLCLSPPESDSKEDEEKSPEPIDKKPQIEGGSRDDAVEEVESEIEMPIVYERSETDSENGNSAEKKPETRPYTSRTNSTNRTAGHSTNRSSRTNAGGRHSGLEGDTESDTHTEEKNIPHHTTKEIEHIGMKYARRYEEEERDCTVEDVSTKKFGFDLRSTAPNGEIRCIEVKARAERNLVVLTPNEWHKAKQLKDGYFLYVVLNAATQPKLYIIKNPADEVEVKEVEQVEIRYQVSLSEIIEHGKLV